MKRLFDILVSLITLALFLPVGIVVSMLIALESRGGVFYRQKRIGLEGKPFYMFKFRTMRPDSDRLGQLTVGARDSRITRVGYVLRKFKLDEFPQFLNVLIGQMSVVGPRPEVEKYVLQYNAEQRKVLAVKPGITDYASLEYFEENRILGEASDPEKTYVEEIMPAKLAINLRYIDNPGLGQDLKIIWLTAKKIMGSK